MPTLEFANCEGRAGTFPDCGMERTFANEIQIRFICLETTVAFRTSVGINIKKRVGRTSQICLWINTMFYHSSKRLLQLQMVSFAPLSPFVY